MNSRLCRKIPSSARERAIFLPGKDGEAGDVGFIVDAAGCSQAKKGPLEARSSFPTQPWLKYFALVIVGALCAPAWCQSDPNIMDTSSYAKALKDHVDDRGMVKNSARRDIGLPIDLPRSQSENSIWLRAALFPPGCIRLHRR